MWHDQFIVQDEDIYNSRTRIIDQSIRHFVEQDFHNGTLVCDGDEIIGETDGRTSQAQKITNWVDPKDKTGEFKRGASVFRNSISREPGAEFPAEKGRYHLYVSYACPWGM